MLQPKIYIAELDKILEVKLIDFDNEEIEAYDGDKSIYSYFNFFEVEFIENTGYIDKNGTFIYLRDIVEIAGSYFEIKYRALKGYVIENEEYTLSLEANLDSVSIVGNVYENKELLE